MSLVLQNPLSNTTYRIKFYSQIIATTHFNPTKTLKFSLFHRQSLQFKAYPLHRNISYLQIRLSHIKSLNSPISAFEEEHKSSTQLFKFDAFLLFLESICIVSSVLISLGCFVYWVLFKQHNHGVLMLGNRILIWLLAGAVGVGAVIRRRQWIRVCGVSSRSKSISESGNVIERIEKLEESMKSSTSIIRMLSKQLEKLGIRFRLTRKSLKEPISETAALAQKNSEATRALAVQEGILEKELAEVQNVLLAMQDQQQKQLELILAIAKSGKLIDNKQAPSQGSDTNKRVSDIGLRQADGKQVQVMAAQKGTANERASGS